MHAGCYLARADRCKIQMDPFTLNLMTGKKLVRFSLESTRISTGKSNSAPSIGSTYTPSLVKKDFAAACGQVYTVCPQGQDTGDANPLNLSLTARFTCPTGTYTLHLPVMYR